MTTTAPGASGQAQDPPRPSTTRQGTTTAWIAEALQRRPATGSVEVEGTRIAFRTWESERSTPGSDVLLVHGGGAHAGWWDHIAPLLAQNGKVAALDLSGHGDSEHRDLYDMGTWCDEVRAVWQATGLSRDATVVGHSLGGLITLWLREKGGQEVSRAVVVDSPVGGPDAQELPQVRGFGVGRRIHATREDAVARFVPVPTQAVVPEVREHVAAASIRPVEGGWTWKFDQRIIDGTARLRTTLPGPGGRLAYLRAEHGMVSPAVREHIEAAGGLYLELPGAGHAPMLDQPAALVGALRALIAGWSRTGR